MYDLDAIAAINVDQIVTATDRLLFGNVHKRRPVARGSQLAVAVARASDERTLYVRDAGAMSYVTVLGAAAAALWLAVALVCLLA